MYPAPFTYHRPASLDEVLSLLDEHEDEAALLAGGQSLVPMMTLRLATPAVLVDLGGLVTEAIRLEDDELVIPAATRHVDILRDPIIAQHAPMMTSAAAHIGNVRVRNRGTIGGSVAHADPSAEWPCVLAALGGSVQLASSSGTRDVAIPDFFESFMTTARQPNEVVTEIRVPVAAGGGQAFVEMTRRANDFAVVEVAAVVTLDHDRRYGDMALAIGGVAQRPVTLTNDERAMARGQVPGDQAVADLVESVVSRLDPYDDAHGSADYRRHLARHLSAQALATAVAA